MKPITPMLSFDMSVEIRVVFPVLGAPVTRIFVILSPKRLE
jgi:hypothetical protein